MVSTIRVMGVDTSGVIWDREGRVGIIYAETGSPPRPNRVIYDRSHSSATTMAPEEVDWEFVRSASHLHLTGITAAIGGACFKTIKKALDEARKGGLTISVDVNFGRPCGRRRRRPRRSVPFCSDLTFCSRVIKRRGRSFHSEEGTTRWQKSFERNSMPG